MLAVIPAQDFLLGAYIFSGVFFVVGLLTYAIWRDSRSQEFGEKFGNVQIGHFTKFDLLGIALVWVLTSLAVLAPFLIPPSGDGSQLKISASAVIQSMGLTILLAFLPIGLLSRRESLMNALGLRWRNWGRQLVVVIFGGILGMIVLSVLLSLLVKLLGLSDYPALIEEIFGESDEQAVVTEFRAAKDQALIGAMVVAAVVVAPLTEEIMFRGYLYGASKSLSGRCAAAIFSSLVFALAHGSALALLPLFILALLLVLAYEWTGSLWAPIALHMVFNGLSMIQMKFGDLEEAAEKAAWILPPWF